VSATLKGLVLAGGSGKRLRPLTYSGAKQLVPVANRPILFYVIDNLVAAGITDIVVVISPQTGDEIQAALGDGARFGARLDYLVQDRPAGLAHAVRCARPRLDDHPFAMYLGDNLIGSGIGDAAAAFRADPALAARVMLKRVPNPSAFGVATVDLEGRVTRLVEKPTVPESDLALVGIYFFRPAIYAAIDRIAPSARGELEITDAISELIALGHTVRFDRLEAWWLDTGKKDDLLLANSTVLDDWLVPGCEGTVDLASEIAGRVRIGPGATVTRSRIRGPVVIGAGAVITDSVIGPFTAIGDRVVIESSRVEHSVVMEDARIGDIARLEDSLVGRRVRVGPGRAGAGALSLLVGDDCVVERS